LLIIDKRKQTFLKKPRAQKILTMRKIGVLSIIVLLSLLGSGLTQKVPEMDVHTDKIPKTEVGEVYHKTAAKVDQLLGDNVNRRTHEVLVKEKHIKDKVDDVTDNVKLKTQDAFEALKNSFGSQTPKASTSSPGDKIRQAKARLQETLQTGKNNMNEAKLHGEDLLEVGKRKLENIKEKTTAAFGGAPKSKSEQMKDKLHEVADEMKTSAHETLDRAKDSTSSIKESFSDKIHQIHENAHRAIPSEKLRREDFLSKGRRKLEDMKESASFSKVPETKVGEMYHKAAGKIDGVLGDEAGKRKHETLVREKQVKDKIDSALHLAKDKAHEAVETVKNAASAASGFATGKLHPEKHAAKDSVKTRVGAAAERVKQEGLEHLQSAKAKSQEMKERTTGAYEAIKNRGGEAAAKVNQGLHEAKDKLQGR